jgi:hypothetical protein
MHIGIGKLRESSLHQSLKDWYYKPGDLLETYVEGYVVDLLRGELCVEIQTGNFTSIKKKISTLLETHSVRIVFPIPLQRIIVRMDMVTENVLTRRKSPKRGSYLDVIGELIRIPHLVCRNNFELEVLLVREEQIWLNDGKGSWRRKGWSITDRRLIEVVQGKLFASPEDYLDLLPAGLPEVFTVNDLAIACQTTRRFAGKMAYCLKEFEAIEVCGKKARAYLYRINRNPK